MEEEYSRIDLLMKSDSTVIFRIKYSITMVILPTRVLANLYFINVAEFQNRFQRIYSNFYNRQKSTGLVLYSDVPGNLIVALVV